MKKIILSTFYVFIVSILSSQDDKSWNVNEPKLPYDSVLITTNEGTWTSVDVSPDGKYIVFDRMGDIFMMPISGGEAKVLREGHAFETQPRFSPDGQKISFTSDAEGGDNIWVMDVDGSNAHSVTNETFRLTNNAVWHPNGEYLVCRKHFSSGRSLGAGEIWMYHISGGEGIQLTTRKNNQQDVGEPFVSDDGKYVYYSEDMYEGGYFQYNKDPNKEIYVINRYSFEDGSIEKITGGPGSAFRPVVSHDNKTLAFVKRVREKTVLYLHNLKTGEEWPIYDELSKDQIEAWAIFGPYTGFSFTPDDKSIVIWAQGKIQKIDIKTKEVVEVSYKATSTYKIVKALQFENQAFEAEFKAKAIRNAITSPNGKWLVFHAAGYLYKKELPNGKPERLTKGNDFEYEPSFSKNGKKLVFVTWNDEDKGKIVEMSFPSGKIKQLSFEKGIYREPNFSPVDEHLIVYRKESGNIHQGYTFTVEPGIYILNKSAKTTKRISKQGMFPQFNVSGDRVFYQTGGYIMGAITKELHSVKIDGTDNQLLFKSKYGQKIVVSPDNGWVAFSNLYKVYLAKMPMVGKELLLTPNTKSFPVTELNNVAGYNIHWSNNSEEIHWTLGSQYFSANLNQSFSFLNNDNVEVKDTIGIEIGLVLKSDIPNQLMAFTNARIITMENDEVIEKGIVVVKNNLIQSVGENVEIPNNAKIIDLKGKTIMPGFIDVHAHQGEFRYGIPSKHKWEYYTNLAYGVTTTHDPSANSEMVFNQSEMVKTGGMVGPRVFSTGIILYGADGDFKAKINNYEDAYSSVKRTKAFGAFSVKSYNQPRRDQRQQVIQASSELEIRVVPEGGSTFYHNLTHIMDGHTGVEHNLPIAVLRDDVIQLWSAANTQYTPTLIVNYGSMTGEYYWYQKTNVWENEKLLNFTPRSVIDPRSRHRTMIPDSEYDHGYILTSQSCKRLTDKGVKVNLGAHGQIQGIGAHWELWMIKQGGVTNMEALKSATINGAHYLGMQNQIGSIKEGKYADLIVIDGNPLENIYDTEKVIYTMVNGRFYDASKMIEVGSQSKPYFYWQNEKYAPIFDWHEHTHSQCSCRH